MAYAVWSVVFGEQPSASKWNILGTNDAAFNNGSGLPTTNAKNTTIATSETTASTSYTDLATPGPSVSPTIGASGLALMVITMFGSCSSSGTDVLGSPVVSGANTISAAANEAIGTWHFTTAATNQLAEFSYARLLTGLSAGATTFKLQYRVTSGTGTFIRRTMSVIPL